MPYSGNPAASPSDAVRFEVGDTDVANPELQDAEVLYCLAQESSVLRAASRAARTIAARYARQVDAGGGALRAQKSQRAKAFHALAVDLWSRADREDAMPYAAGISIADKEANEEDDDVVQPDITRHLFDLPGSGIGSMRGLSGN